MSVCVGWWMGEVSGAGWGGGGRIVLYFQFKGKCGYTTKYFMAVDLKE